MRRLSVRGHGARLREAVIARRLSVRPLSRSAERSNGCGVAHVRRIAPSRHGHDHTNRNGRVCARRRQPSTPLLERRSSGCPTKTSASSAPARGTRCSTRARSRAIERGCGVQGAAVGTTLRVTSSPPSPLLVCENNSYRVLYLWVGAACPPPVKAALSLRTAELLQAGRRVVAARVCDPPPHDAAPWAIARRYLTAAGVELCATGRSAVRRQDEATMGGVWFYHACQWVMPSRLYWGSRRKTNVQCLGAGREHDGRVRHNDGRPGARAAVPARRAACARPAGARARGRARRARPLEGGRRRR